MSSLIVEGGHRLQGNISPQGAKNEALEVICATLLTPERVVISNLPDIADVRNLISLIEEMGVETEHIDNNTVSFSAKEIDTEYLYSEQFRKKAQSLRGSVMIVGPLLARFGKAILPKPGGDKIGRRRLDTHFWGWQKLGAEFEYDELGKYYNITAPNGLKGCYMLLDEASVTGTANIIMAAVLASGVTTIYNAACEPYIQQLCKMLVRMGAKITGIGSNLLTICGVDYLGGTDHKMLPDMIEVGSFIGVAAMTGSDIVLENVGIDDLGIMPECFRRLGVNMEVEGDNIHVRQDEIYAIDSFMDGSIMTFSDAPWPGLSPDLLSIFLVVATQAKGSVLIHQKMFESRLFFVDKLIDMGAKIILCDPHRAAVIGAGKFHCLHSTNMVSPDIRAGIAMLIAALGARGTSRIQNINQIDRGYERIDERLNKLGAHIIRSEE
ncbi:UDP-N-acetylglucosamine 1-carboxyvinyltransferase [Lepagella muris]|jgi:UDP-N-acetylglucosamine 1-carboxyvinyltransferase|uniref:UDP-N-acetylglucosamine 1-carboxyvinyltransferase n=1 Tax=Lepagella muris TaxID=3032870 RepID=A0AC61RIH2_9BACT|nr:UDP-N-acetylglucosamine 1-carboxyvinyltransferase [Lepagella muris]ROT09306.1 UDP-N-acetylglucosamine 1-carboxyvinyltransferase [Muribaculaceae bacterium Isolate-037 (Harlan)]TGY77049.1 UDP-N-acetylglucosamine 1-carboxyvinyltransferase [Lepagella muris]THG47052.1 UDP-N-acetylglucosamine 1-carboxyvinyltransferase [Bacteroidales bacterium]TKC54346.1 UDP-N-acetylglucosamine 1-carboxyvinyltransferase [Bacteroidales bacterium]